MSTTIDEAALESLLHSPDGPVGINLKLRANKVKEIADARIDIILAKVPGSARPRTVVEISFAEGDLRAEIGLVKSDVVRKETLEEYLGKKEGTERAWLVPALKKGFEGAE